MTNTIVNIFIGVLITVIGGLVLSYFRRSRLKIYVHPNRRWLFDNLYSPDFSVKIVNIGLEKAEIDNFKIEFRKGSKILFVNEDILHKSLITIEAKSSQTTTINCSTIYKKHPEYFKEYSVVRIVAITPSQRVYKSDWIELKNVIEKWDEVV